MKTLPASHGTRLLRIILLAAFFMPLSVLPATPDTKPQRIVSLGLCTDQLLLLMADKAHIASLTSKANDPLMSYMAEAVGDIPLNNAAVEDVIPYNPDLVLASRFASQDSVRMLRTLGYRVELIDLPTRIDEVYELVRLVGYWIGESENAENLVAGMQSELEMIRKRNEGKKVLKAIIYSPNGYTIGSNTLENDVLKTAGYINIAEQLGIDRFQKISLEKLIQSKPDVLLIDNHVYNKNSLASKHIVHPVLDRIVPEQRQLFIPSRFRACPGPMTVDAVAYLADKR